ncbi:MAG: cytochrome c oxidase subunit 3 [Flavobacteriales bacterium]|nr:cytochrome c oxidase subunit 3 [Flavobacteriales bacterium]
MAGHSKQVSKEELWGGGQSPMSISYGKMMMWYFLVSDALTFGGLLTSYGVIRHASADAWPVGEQVFESLPFLGSGYPLIYVALMTFILIISSVTMVLAVEAGHRLDNRGVIKWLGYTIIGGMFFVGSQGWEWYHFIHGGGGGFQLAKTVQVNAINQKGETMPMTLAPGTWVHMPEHFGHGYEHAMDAGHQVHVIYGEAPAGAAHNEEHTTATHDAHAGAHGHGHEAASTEHHGPENLYLEKLHINKYTLERVDNKDYRKLEAKGADVQKLWEAKAANSFAFGANLHKNEYGKDQQYSNFFFFITGFHGFHVFSGVVINIIVWLMVIRGVFMRRGHYEMIEKIGLYWHFVDLVWVFVFTFYYLV